MFDDIAVVRRLRTSAQLIVEQTQHVGADAFRGDANLRASVLAHIQEIVRTADEFSPEFVDEHDEIPWLLAEMRRHCRSCRVGEVDPGVLWDIVARDVVLLAKELAALSSSLS